MIDIKCTLRHSNRDDSDLLAYLCSLISLPFSHTCIGLPQSGKNIWKMNFFQVRDKSGNLVGSQGNLERTRKVREFENKWLWQAVLRKFIYSAQEGKGCTF